MEFISDFRIFHPSIFEFSNSRAFIMERPLIDEIRWSNSERTSRGVSLYSVLLRHYTIPSQFGKGMLVISYTPAVMVPIYKVTRVIKMLNFHQNADFREKIWITRISEFFDQLTPLLDHTFSDHLVKQQKTTRDKIRCKNSSCLIKA